MRKIISVLAIVGLMLGAVTAAEAGKKKKKKAKPVKTTLYFHGTETVGEVDLVNHFGTAYNKMDASEPTEAAPKSLQFTTWAGDPQMWNDCAGSYLLPVWTGEVSGKVKGNITVTLHTVSGPKAVTVQVWPDLMTQTCASNDLSEGEYPEPAVESTVDLPPGAGESKIVLKKANFKAIGGVTVQILPHGPAPGRVLYDSTEFTSSIEFKCIPTRGKKCTP